jgi:hypothetical protein
MPIGKVQITDNVVFAKLACQSIGDPNAQVDSLLRECGDAQLDHGIAQQPSLPDVRRRTSRAIAEFEHVYVQARIGLVNSRIRYVLDAIGDGEVSLRTAFDAEGEIGGELEMLS